MINKDIKNKINRRKKLDKEIYEEARKALQRLNQLGLDKENAFEHADHFEWDSEDNCFEFWSENYEWEREHAALIPERAIYDGSWWKEKEAEAEEKRLREETEKARAQIIEEEKIIEAEQKELKEYLRLKKKLEG